jgi:hypothetical protein
MLTSIPQIFMPVVSGYYLDQMGIAKGVRVGLMLFIGAASIATIVRAIFLTETLKTEDMDDHIKNESGMKGLLEVFRRQPRTIYAMMAVSIISGFAMRMTWTFLTPYATYEVGLSTTQYGLLQSVATGISVPLYFDSLSLLMFRDYNQLLAAYGVIGVAGGLGGGRLRGGGFMGGPAWQALIADLVPQRDRGKVMGLMGTVSGIIGLPGSYIGGVMYDRNPNMLLAVGAGLEALAIPLILFFVKDQKDIDVD